MNDWQVGDLAVCVTDGPLFRGAGLFKGRVYRVTDVVLGKHKGVDNVTGLVLAGMEMPPGKRGAVASQFRKIRPDSHESCEPEFAQLLKRIKVGERT